MKKRTLAVLLTVIMLFSGVLAGCGPNYNDYLGNYELSDYKAQVSIQEDNTVVSEMFQISDIYSEITVFLDRTGVIFSAVPVSDTFAVARRPDKGGGNITINTPLIFQTFSLMEIRVNKWNTYITVKYRNDEYVYLRWQLDDGDVRLYLYEFFNKTFSGSVNLFFSRESIFEKIGGGGNNGGTIASGSYSCYKVYNTILNVDISNEFLANSGYRFVIKENNKVDLYVKVLSIEAPAVSGSYSVSGSKLNFDFSDASLNQLYKNVKISGSEFIWSDGAGTDYYFKK